MTGRLDRVVRTMDNAIHRKNYYPADKYYGNQLRYLLESALSGGQRYPAFEQLGRDYYKKNCWISLLTYLYVSQFFRF